MDIRTGCKAVAGDDGDGDADGDGGVAEPWHCPLAHMAHFLPALAITLGS